MRARFEYLNHACMLIETEGVRLLCDPWLEGFAFSGGWGLAYDHPAAIERACVATHLWVSHWHSDHLHLPTLAKIAKRAPRMIVVANVSHNFSMMERLSACGFRDVRPIAERAPMRLSRDVVVTRYPTAGIDNMLHIATSGMSILNYNDCNLPEKAARAIAGKLGPVDVLLTNYNHAGKLFDDIGDAATKDLFFRSMVRTVDAIAPRFVIPFASSHTYRAAYSRPQNASLIDFEELESRTSEDERFVVLRVGDRVEIEASELRRERLPGAVTRAFVETHEYGASVQWDDVVEAVSQRCVALGQRFPVGHRLCPPLRVRVEDHRRILVLRLGHRAVEARADDADIRAHSRALADWHGRRFGDDTFFAGAHFGVEGKDSSAIRAWALVTLLAASHLDPRSAIESLRSHSGRAFFWNRREELWGTLAARSIRAGQLRA